MRSCNEKAPSYQSKSSQSLLKVTPFCLSNSLREFKNRLLDKIDPTRCLNGKLPEHYGTCLITVTEITHNPPLFVERRGQFRYQNALPLDTREGRTGVMNSIPPAWAGRGPTYALTVGT